MIHRTTYLNFNIVLQAARCLVQQTRQGELLRMELLSRKLHALACYCNFSQASNISNELVTAGESFTLSLYHIVFYMARVF